MYAEATRIAATIISPPGTEGTRRARLLKLEGEKVSLLAEFDEGGESGAAAPGPGKLPEAVLQTLADGEPRVVRLEDLTVEDHSTGAGTGAASWAVARVPMEPGPYGLLSVTRRSLDQFAPSDLTLLAGIADLTGLAISNSVKHADLQALKERLQLGLEFAMEAGSALEPQRVIDGVLERGRAAVGADRITIARFDGDWVEVVSSQVDDLSLETWTGRKFPMSAFRRQPLIDQAIETRRPAIGGALNVEQAEKEVKSSIQTVRHTVVVPLLLGEEMAGILVATRVHDAAFTLADAALLQQLGGVATLALRNALLLSEARAAREVADLAAQRLSLAVAAAEDVAAELELPDVQWRLLERAMVVVRADRGGIARLEGETLIVQHKYDLRHEPPKSADVIALADSPLAAETIRGRKAMLWNHLSPEQATGRGITSRTSVSSSEVGEHPPRHALHYPLVVEQEVIGLLSLSRVRDEPFTEADLLGLQEFGTLTALIVRNAHLLAAAIDISRAKSKFVNLAAHELRTPVSVLKGYLSMIADGVFEVSDEVRDGPIQVALDKVVELDDLVEQLVLVARLEAGKFVASASNFAARDAVRESVDRVRKKLRPEAASFEVSSSEGGAMVRADRDSVRWVLAHLLRNAVAFSSPPAQIKIAVRATSPVEIAVEDRGYGIPPQHHARVFEPFFRLDDTGQAMVSGAGLGLSIGRELAERSGGSLELERSVPGEGSVFVLRLPAVQANEGRAIAVVGDGGALEPRQGTG